MENRNFKGVWIPREIWLNTELSAIDKVILTEISSLDNENHCTASNEYFAQFCDVSVATIVRSIKKLKDLNLIETKMVTTPTGSQRLIKMSIGGSNQNEQRGLIKMSSNYNINNNINISKDISTQTEKPKKESMYDKCVSKIMEFTSDEKLQNALLDYLPVRLANKDKPLLGVNQWVGMLNKLAKMSSQEDVVRQSIAQGWAMFYELKASNNFGKYNNATEMNCNKNVNAESMKEQDVRDLNRQIERRIRNGERIEF